MKQCTRCFGRPRRRECLGASSKTQAKYPAIDDVAKSRDTEWLRQHPWRAKERQLLRAKRTVAAMENLLAAAGRLAVDAK